MSILETLAFSIGITLYLAFWATLLVVPPYLHVEHDWAAKKMIPALLGVLATMIFTTTLIGNHFFGT